jgi:surfactin synthase thioesterase subunit
MVPTEDSAPGAALLAGGAPAVRARPPRWVLREPARESSGRLFCIPYSGCGASMYRAWPRFIGDLEVCPVQLPGRENRMREAPFATYPPLAAALIEGLEPYLDRPFAFFGHCGSALPGYEATVQLAERGGPVPACLFVSSQVAPHHGPIGRFLMMDDDELAEELKTLFRQLGGSPPPDMIDLCLRVLRADVDANRKYRPSAPVRLPCLVSAIGWERDGEVDHRLMVGWSDCGETKFRTLPGEHYRFLQAPAELLAAISEDMAAAAERAG